MAQATPPPPSATCPDRAPIDPSIHTAAGAGAAGTDARRTEMGTSSGMLAFLLFLLLVMVMVVSPVGCTGKVLQLHKMVPPAHVISSSSSSSSSSSHFERVVARDRARHPRIFEAIVDFPLVGDPLLLGEYYTTVHLGTPPREFHVQVDTGSDVFWVACSLCANCSTSTLLDIQLNWFNTSASSTSEVISCSDPVCAPTASTAVQCADSCGYTMEFEDGSGTSGYFVADVLNFDTITPNSVSRFSARVAFGCSTDESGLLRTTFNALDGILGFGQGHLSFVSQLSSKQMTPRAFSHCLRGDGNGMLVLGEVVEPGIVYTPLLPARPHYTLDLRSIAVNGQAVFASGSNQEAIIDSGTSLAYFMEEVFDALVNAVTVAVSQSATPIKQGEVMCYKAPTSSSEIFPVIILTFADGATMLLRVEDYLLDSGYHSGGYLWCIAFKKAREVTILGDLLLKDKIIVYNLERQLIGWATYNCSLPLTVSSVYTGDSTNAWNHFHNVLLIILLILVQFVAYA